MLFRDSDGDVCAYIRNRGFVCVDQYSTRYGQDLPPQAVLRPECDCDVFTNPYGDVVLSHVCLGQQAVYNTVLQECQHAVWPNLFLVGEGERNPYTEMLRSPVRVRLCALQGGSLNKRTEDRVVTVKYEPRNRRVFVFEEGTRVLLFTLSKEELVNTYGLRCVDDEA